MAAADIFQIFSRRIFLPSPTAMAGNTKNYPISPTPSTAIGNALKSNGSTMIEVDMATIGAYARPFGGPPVKKD